ncbi:succinoglycan biosynthesis ketolase [Stanieria sp. NIES-3757]|nr:succinoglycan biosynthesis ketolase [Stanieria sp. NIES-3757]
MRLIYYKQPNFGDALNLWMWQKLIPNIFDDDPSIAFMGLGTLLNESYQRRV